MFAACRGGDMNVDKLPLMDDGTSSPKLVNDSKTDAYRVFGKMLKSGHPPDDWDTLLAEALWGQVSDP